MLATIAVAGNASAATRQPATSSVTIKVAVVSNPNMELLEALTPVFEKENPGIKVEYDTLPEDSERQLIETDVTTHANEFNAVMISNYETPIWAKNGWLANLSAYTAKDPSYDVSDLVAPLRQALSVDGKLYSVPFYGESSMMYYRTDLFKAAGLTMPDAPDLGPDSVVRPEAEQPVQGRRGDMPAGRARLGRKPGRAGHRHQHLGRGVVQPEMAAPARRPPRTQRPPTSTSTLSARTASQARPTMASPSA